MRAEINLNLVFLLVNIYIYTFQIIYHYIIVWRFSYNIKRHSSLTWFTITIVQSGLRPIFLHKCVGMGLRV